MDQKSKRGIWRGKPPASEAAIHQLTIDSRIALPVSYLNQLRRSNGGEGDIGVEPGWIQFWKAEEVIENNLGYELGECLPGYFGFGSNGGGELLAMKVYDPGRFSIYMIPFIVISEKDAVRIARDFDVLVEAVGVKWISPTAAQNEDS